jgi:hypothetical protein
MPCVILVKPGAPFLLSCFGDDVKYNFSNFRCDISEDQEWFGEISAGIFSVAPALYQISLKAL